MNMKLRYRLFLRRKSVYYAFNDTTKTFISLKTKDKAEATRRLMAMKEAGQQPAINLSLARVYLRHSDPMVSTRTCRTCWMKSLASKSVRPRRAGNPPPRTTSPNKLWQVPQATTRLPSNFGVASMWVCPMWAWLERITNCIVPSVYHRPTGCRNPRRFRLCPAECLFSKYCF